MYFVPSVASHISRVENWELSDTCPTSHSLQGPNSATTKQQATGIRSQLLLFNTIICSPRVFQTVHVCVRARETHFRMTLDSISIDRLRVCSFPSTRGRCSTTYCSTEGRQKATKPRILLSPAVSRNVRGAYVVSCAGRVRRRDRETSMYKLDSTEKV